MIWFSLALFDFALKKKKKSKEIPLAVLRFPRCLITSYQCCLISSISRYYRSGGLNVVGLCVSRTILQAVTLNSGELTFIVCLFARLQHYKLQCLPFFIVINLPKASLRWSSTLLKLCNIICASLSFHFHFLHYKSAIYINKHKYICTFLTYFFTSLSAILGYLNCCLVCKQMP